MSAEVTPLLTMPDPANVAANWAKYFDDTHQCNYYYNSVTQESSWSRPACMEFVKTHSQKSSSLLSAAFGSNDENETGNTTTTEQQIDQSTEPQIDQSTESLGQASPKPPVPTVKSPQESKRSEMASSFDSNDEFFAQLEEEVDTANKETSEEDKARILKREEEENARRQAELEKLEEERAAAAAAQEAAEVARRQAEKEAELAARREAERLEEEAKAKRQEDLDKIAEEEKKRAERAREQAEIEAAELKVKQAAKEKQQAELEKFKAQKKAEMEAKQKAEEEAELARVKEKEEAVLRRKAEVERLTSGVDDKADEIDDEDEVIDYALSISKAEESPREIDDESDVQVIQEKAEVVSEVEDSVEHHRAATQLQALQRGRQAKKRVHGIKKEAKKKRYDEFMSKQEEKEKDIIAMQIKNGVNNNAQMDAAAVKLQALQRQRSTKKEVKAMKKQKNEAAVKLQALHRRRASQRRFREMKLERPLPQSLKADNSREKELPAINDSDVSGQSSATSLHAIPHQIEITEIKSAPDNSEPVKVVPVAQSKPQVVASHKSGQQTKPKKEKKAPRNNPRDAIAEAARFLEKNEKNANNDHNKQPTVPETKSDELTLPEISCSHQEPQVIRRKKRNNGLSHVNKRTMESLEKLEKVAKETAPPPMESKSAPPSGSPLPRIRPPRVAETERRKKKEPLFMRLEAQARQRSMAIEKEKRDNYLKIKESKKEAKPSREAIMQHMRKYDEERKAHVNKEKEYAEAKKKEWHEKAKKLKNQNKSPPRKKLWDSESGNSDEPGSKKKKHEPNVKPTGDMALIVTPRKVKKKLFRKKKKLDFVEEEKERRAQEEQAKKDRLAKGKMYGKVAPAKHSKNTTPVKKKLNLIDEIDIPSSPFGGPVAQSIIPSPRSPRGNKLVARISTDDVDTEEARDVLRSPVNPDIIRTSPGNVSKNAPNTRQKRLSRGRSANHDADALSPVLSIPKGSKKRSPLKSRLSSLDDSSSAVFNVDAPYDGIVGSEWVSQVMEMDTEEATLADVYESGFEMFMIEKGIIQDVV